MSTETSFATLPDGTRVALPSVNGVPVDSDGTLAFPLYGNDSKTGQPYPAGTYVTFSGNVVYPDGKVVNRQGVVSQADQTRLSRAARAAAKPAAPAETEPSPTPAADDGKPKGSATSAQVYSYPPNTNIEGYQGEPGTASYRVMEGAIQASRDGSKVQFVGHRYDPADSGSLRDVSIELAPEELEAWAKDEPCLMTTLGFDYKDGVAAQQFINETREQYEREVLDEVSELQAKGEPLNAEQQRVLDAQKQANKEKQDSFLNQQGKEMLDKMRANRDNLENIYDRVIAGRIVMNGAGASDKQPTDAQQREVVDVLNTFGWTYNIFKEGAADVNGKMVGKTSVPYLYATEYQQLYSSSITNFVNSLAAIGGSADSFDKAASNLQELTSDSSYLSGLPLLSGAISRISDTLQKVTGNINSSQGANAEGTQKDKPEVQGVVGFISEKVGSIVGAIATKIKNVYNTSPMKGSTLLAPYLWLYSVKETNKAYVFPFVNSTAAAYDFKSSWDKNPDESSLFRNALFKAVTKFSEMSTNFSNDALKLSEFLLDVGEGNSNNTKGLIDTQVETAKFYKFDVEGESVTVTFPLYNTFKRGLWKQHYQFIFNFALRNLPFRLDNMSYKVPVLYDVVIPGYKHLPIAYVRSFKAEPQGIIHVMKTSNSFISQYVDNLGEQEIAVYVPEAWNVTIEFTSLVSKSGNTLLSAMADVPISVDFFQSESSEQPQ